MKRNWLMMSVVACLLTVGSASCHSLLERRQAFTVEDLAGMWQADYSHYGVPDLPQPDMSRLGQPMSGVETITLEPDGSFRQSFSGNGGELAHGAWTLEDGDTLHLPGAGIYIYGRAFADALARKEARVNTSDCHGKDIELDGSELILCVRSDRNAVGGVVLQHLEVGDPDAPVFVTFRRTSP